MSEGQQKHVIRAQRFLVASFFIIALYSAASFLFPNIQETVLSWFISLQEYAVTHGLWGMLVFAIAANATLLLNIPYSAAAVLLAGLGLNPFLIAIVAGVGAMIGEVTGYLIGWGGAKLFIRSQNDRFNALRSLLERKKRMTPLLIFAFGALPIPDDILIVPLGVIRYSFWKMVVPMTLGKFVQNLYFALLGAYSLGMVDLTKHGSGFFIGLISLTLLLGAMYFVLRIDWLALIDRWTRRNEGGTL